MHQPGVAVIILKIELFLEIRKNVSSVEEKEPEMTSLKSQLSVAFGISGHSCADSPENRS